MKKVLLIFFTVFFLCVFSLKAADFKKEIVDYRKATIKMCAQLQAGKPAESKEQLLKEINALDKKWNEITKNFIDNPPDEYKKDPQWKSYFQQVKENNSVVKSFVEKEKYKSAVRFCGMSCRLFVSMDETNGIKTLAGKLFLLRDVIRNIKSMLDAENITDAKMKAEQLKKITDDIKQNEFKDTKDEKQKNLIKTAENFYNQIKSKDILKEKVNEVYDNFLKAFNPVYFDSL